MSACLPFQLYHSVTSSITTTTVNYRHSSRAEIPYYTIIPFLFHQPFYHKSWGGTWRPSDESDLSRLFILFYFFAHYSCGKGKAFTRRSTGGRGVGTDGLLDQCLHAGFVGPDYLFHTISFTGHGARLRGWILSWHILGYFFSH